MGGLKDPIIPHPDHARSVFDGLEAYRSLVDQEDLSFIYVGYGIFENYEIELPRIDKWIDNPPPSRLGVYEDAFEARLRFSLVLFVLKLLRPYGMLLYVLTSNSIRHIIGFWKLYFLAEIRPSLSLFYFFLTRKHPYVKIW